MDYTIKTTPELAVGDVVRTVYGRLRLTEVVIDAAQARAIAEAARSLAPDGADAQADFEDAVTLRAFRVEALAFVTAMPPDFILRGTRHRRWDVESA